MVNKILIYVSTFLALLIVLPVHEFAHAFAAVKSGDDTPRLMGRYTLNPYKHFDPIGLICMVLVGFGWAKPVMVNLDNFKHRTLDSLWVAVSGVLANVITAFVVFPIYILSLRLPHMYYFGDIIQYTLQLTVMMSLSFAVFNFLPLMPLDGFRVIQAFTKRENSFRVFMERYSGKILLGLIILDFIGSWGSQIMPWMSYLQVLSETIGYLGNLLLKPISAFWGLIF